MRRIAYSPDVRVYIQPSLVDKKGDPVPPIDISNDIIEGSVERRSNDISTARFVLQSRRLGVLNSNDPTSSLLLSRQIRPMDKIVVYLKKTKPILVFSGYIDLVPLVQFVPEPVVIEASCTLKRLQYTYWDPTLPNVISAFSEMGMVPVSQNGEGLSVSQPPGADSTSGNIEDQGFPKLLSFLLIDVGGWDASTVYIEPLPQEWLDRVEPLFRTLDNTDATWDNAKIVLENALGIGGGDGGGDGGGGDGNGGVGGGNVNITAQEVQKNAREDGGYSEEFINLIPEWFAASKKFKVDPVFGVAISAFESARGNSDLWKNAKNVGGLTRENSLTIGLYGPKNFGKYRTLKDSVNAQMGPQFLSGETYKGLDTISAIAPVYCEDGDRVWAQPVKTFYKKLSGGANPDAYIKGPEYEKAVREAAANNTPNRTPSGTGAGTQIEKNKIVVYIQAFDSGETEDSRLPGYQKKDVFGRVLFDGSSDNRIKDNIRLVNLINDSLKRRIGAAKVIVKQEKLNEDNPIEIKVITSSKDIVSPQGQILDLHLVIDHSNAQTSNNTNDYAITMVQPSMSARKLTQPDAGPASSTFGTGWQSPLRSINQKGLIFNSTQFIKSLSASGYQSSSSFNIKKLKYRTKAEIEQESNVNAQLAWTGTIPEFFYTNSYACVYLQFPNPPSKKEEAQKIWAEDIAGSIFDYWWKFKIRKRNGGQKQIDEVGAAAGTDQSGTDTFSYETLTAEGFELMRGGEGNDWAGSMWRCLALQKIANIIPSSQKRDDKMTESENISDHWVGSTKSYAMDLPGFPDDGKTDAAATAMVKTLGGPDNWGKTGGVKDINYDGYRYQFLWRTNEGGNHYNHIHVGVKKIGTSENLPIGDIDVSGGSSDEDASSAYQDAVNYNRAAFNVAYNFPGSLVDSVVLTGQRALQNDVPLFDSVKDIVIGSMRNFCSLPNGDFIAWFPDYFNIAKRNPWLKVSKVEIKRCTIDFSDKALATHIYIMGNPWGVGSLPTADASWYQKLQGAGVVTIEQEGLLNSFIDGIQPKGTPASRTTLDPIEEKEEQKTSALDFLEKYGARPYSEQNLTLRHPLIEFFYAYNTFMKKWAEQFVSRVEFTFMPELFPGMIVEIPNYQKDGKSYTFYVQDVVHNFNYTTGFNTTATLIAPGQNQGDVNIGMVPVRPPSDIGVDGGVREKRRFKIKKVPSNATSATEPNPTASPEGR